MIGQSWPEYIFIRICITSLRLVAPLSITYLCVCALLGHVWLSVWLAPPAVVEAVFFLLVYLPRRVWLQKPAKNSSPPLDYSERQELFKRCSAQLSTSNSDDFRSWFAPDGFKRENLRRWLLWALFSCDIGGDSDLWKEELDGYITTLETVLGMKLDSGLEEEVKSMRLNYDPVQMTYRPLLWYLIVGLVDFMSSLALLRCGFRHYATPKWFNSFPLRPLTIFSRQSADPNLAYWYRPHRSTTKPPVLFLHGIGIGLYPYIPFLKALIVQEPDIGIVVIEFLPISARITYPPLHRPANCLAISRILNVLAIPRVVVASHSYGTVITSHMLHSPELAPRIIATLLIDPIPFLLHLPAVAHNFVYRQPKTANEWQLWYFASRDPDISRALSRHFFWSENILWKEELAGLTMSVVLSGSDQIVHAEEVRRYLTGEEEMQERWTSDKLEVLFRPGLDHATIFDSKERRQSLLDIMHRFLRLEIE